MKIGWKIFWTDIFDAVVVIAFCSLMYYTLDFLSQYMRVN